MENVNGTNIYLQLELKKGSFTESEFGDFVFDVEASNENLDLEQQRVLQDSLLNSKEYFLANGVISKDHLHQRIVDENGQKKVIFNEEYVIGEPLKVYTDGEKTRVRGKLYPSNKYAKKFIDLLKAGSSRVKASVGGIAPIVKNVAENGKEVGTIVSVLWNDLALTISPVNPTVSAAYMVKSLSSLEFVKALAAGYSTDHANLTGGRAVVPEDLEQPSIVQPEILQGFITAITGGTINSKKDIEQYFADKNIESTTVKHYIQAVLNTEQLTEVIPMGKSQAWNEALELMRKSYGNAQDNDTEEPIIENDEDAPVIDDDDDDGNGNGGENIVQKAMDAGPILEAMQTQIEQLNGTMDIMSKALTGVLSTIEKISGENTLLGKSLLSAMEQLETLGNTPVPRGSVTSSTQIMHKGGGMAETGGVLKHKQFTAAERDEAKRILAKAVSEGELDIYECGQCETQINKSISDPFFQLDQKFIALLQKKMGQQA